MAIALSDRGEPAPYPWSTPIAVTIAPRMAAAVPATNAPVASFIDRAAVVCWSSEGGRCSSLPFCVDGYLRQMSTLGRTLDPAANLARSTCRVPRVQRNLRRNLRI